MAKSISEEELQLRKRARRRLIGATALVIAVVVFLPMVLDNEPKPLQRQDIDVRIPSPNTDSFVSKVVPVDHGASPLSPAVTPPASAPTAASPAVPAPASVPAPPPAPQSAPAVTQPIKTAASEPPKPVAETAPTPQATPGKPEAKKTAPKTVEKTKSTPKSKAGEKNAGGFVVQVAALNDAAKAKQMEQQLADAGIKGYTEVVPTAKGKVTRVRVGPLKTRDEAEKMRDKLKSIGLPGNIVPE
ncbi:MAG TPA: SPOR domain-containing protein [Burkholderiales bacterium]|nr:SPOR domain-containing protein [Burkholderiales bacterium]